MKERVTREEKGGTNVNVVFWDVSDGFVDPIIQEEVERVHVGCNSLL